MSEQRLRDLGREAEELVDLPDLGSLERRGRALRFRRQVAVVGAAAVVATAGVVLFQDRSTDAPQPAPPRSESVHRLSRRPDAGPRGGHLRADAVAGRHRAHRAAHGAGRVELLGGSQPVRRPPRRRQQRGGSRAQHLARGRHGARRAVGRHRALPADGRCARDRHDVPPDHQGGAGHPRLSRRRSTGPVALLCSDTRRPSSGSPRTPRSRSARVPPSCSAPTPTAASASGAISTSTSSTSRG